MKKLLLIVSLLLVVCGCSASKDKPIELSASEVLEKIQNEKQNSFLLYVTMDNCYSCDEYEKIIQKLEDEESFDVYYMKINLNDEDSDEVKALEELKITIGKVNQIPSTYYFYQGNLLPENKKEGFIEEKDIRKWLKNLQILH